MFRKKIVATKTTKLVVFKKLEIVLPFENAFLYEMYYKTDFSVIFPLKRLTFQSEKKLFQDV